MTVGAVVLAAGGGTRFAGPTHKLLAPFRGRAVVAWAVEHAAGAQLDETIVVVGAVDIDGLPEGVTTIRNERWEEGQATSLQAAVAHAADAGHEAIVVGLGDQPLLPVEAWQAVAAAAATPIAMASYDGQPGHPVRLAAATWPMLPTAGDAGARALVRSRGDLVTLVPCPGQPLDIDTAEDLTRWT
jgi:CTP:molybdopterin cytidylyltransferase MocA